jgi:hypothetical protein
MSKYLLALIALAAALVLLGHMDYDPACCSNEHCHPVACEEIIEKGKTLIYQGLTFSGNMIKSSKDQFCHVCSMKNWLGEHPLCIYIQQGT